MLPALSSIQPDLLISRQRSGVVAATQRLYDAGGAFVCLTKHGGDAVLSYSLAGRLVLSASGWGLLEVPNALVRGAFDALHEPGVALPLRDGRLNGHCTVFSPADITAIGGPDKLKERGHYFHYSLGPLRVVKPAGWPEMSKVWFIEIRSPELEALRRSYGLSSLPKDGKHELHVTIACRRVGSLYDHSPVKNGEKSAASMTDEEFEAAQAEKQAAEEKRTARPRHILLTGHSGAGKSTIAKLLSKQLDLPVHKIDNDHLWRDNKDVADDPERYTPGTKAYHKYRKLRKKLVRHALKHHKPTIIEGSQLLVDPDLLRGHRIVLIDADQPTVVRQRLQRDQELGKLAPDGGNKEMRESKARYLYHELQPAVDALKRRTDVTVVQAADARDWVSKQAPTSEQRPHAPVIGVDLDGTLCTVRKGPHDPDKFGEPRPDYIAIVRRLRSAGCVIIIHTCRGDTDKIEEWLEEHDVPYDHINENPDQPAGSSSKLFAFAYLDDRAVSALEAAETALNKIKALLVAAEPPLNFDAAQLAQHTSKAAKTAARLLRHPDGRTCSIEELAEEFADKIRAAVYSDYVAAQPGLTKEGMDDYYANGDHTWYCVKCQHGFDTPEAYCPKCGKDCVESNRRARHSVLAARKQKPAPRRDSGDDDGFAVEKEAAPAIYGPHQDAMRQLAAHPAVRDWFQRHGLYWSNPNTNAADNVADFRQRGEHWDTMAKAAPADHPTYVRMLNSMADVMGMKSTGSRQQAIDRAAHDVVHISPYAMTFAPKLWDAVHGDRGTAAALASSLYRAHRDTPDPVTGQMGYSPETAAQLAQGVHEKLYGPGADPTLTHGYSAGEMGTLYEHMHRAGLMDSPRPQPPASVAQRLLGMAGPMATLRGLSSQLQLPGEKSGEAGIPPLWHFIDDILAMQMARMHTQETAAGMPPSAISTKLPNLLLPGGYKSAATHHALPVLLRKRSEDDWICPHCGDKIQEKSLYRDKKGWWFHRPCFAKGKGSIELPKSQSESHWLAKQGMPRLFNDVHMGRDNSHGSGRTVTGNGDPVASRAVLQGGGERSAGDGSIREEGGVALPVLLGGQPKYGASALRSRLSLVPRAGDLPGFDMMLAGRRTPVGQMLLGAGEGAAKVNWSQIDSRLQGLGLGKKMYGDVMRRLPGGALHSDNVVSQEAQRVWNSMGKRPGSYQVSRTPTEAPPHTRTTTGEPLFQGSINPKAQLPVPESLQPLAQRIQGHVTPPPEATAFLSNLSPAEEAALAETRAQFAQHAQAQGVKIADAALGGRSTSGPALPPPQTAVAPARSLQDQPIDPHLLRCEEPPDPNEFVVPVSEPVTGLT